MVSIARQAASFLTRAFVVAVGSVAHRLAADGVAAELGVAISSGDFQSVLRCFARQFDSADGILIKRFSLEKQHLHGFAVAPRTFALHGRLVALNCRDGIKRLMNDDGIKLLRLGGFGYR